MNTSPRATKPRRQEPANGRPICFRGYDVIAPGFSPSGFGRLVDRALSEGVQLSPTERPGVFTATRPGSPSSGVVSRSSCTCRDGQRRIACKHRGLLCLALAICGARPRGP